MATNISSVICVSYTDEFSNNKDSHIDIDIGAKHNIVASNQLILNNAKSGTLVQIVASKKSKNRRRVQYGLLDRKIQGECHLWENASPNGRTFKYHWTFTPLTNVLYVYEIQLILDRIADRMNVDIKYIFNSRFCGYGHKYVPLMREVIETGAIPLLN